MSKGDKAIRELFESVVDELTGYLGFEYGTEADKNIFTKEKILDLVWMLPMSYTGEFKSNMKLFKNYSIVLYFCRQDKLDSSNTQRRDITESIDYNVEQFLIKMKFTLDSLPHDHELTNIQVNPFFVATDNILTGKALSFNLEVQDDFEYC